MSLLYFILFILGICFGSFSTVLISRWHSGKGGIITGRSACPHCNHTLSSIELIPLASWIFQGGKCRSCSAHIPVFYPGAELLMGLMFTWAGWISSQFGYTYTDIMFWVFLFWSFVTGVYVLYDLRYKEIPDQIMIPALLIVLISLIGGIWFVQFRFLYDISTYQNYHTFLTDHISAALLLYSFFFLQILIPGILFLLEKKQTKSIPGLLLSFFTFPFEIVLEFFTPKKHHHRKSKKEDEALEIPAWIGGGDLRVALFIGLTLGTVHSLVALACAYIFGSIFSIPLLIQKYIFHQEIDREIPFGPFLALGWIVSLSTYSWIIDYLQLLNL